MPAMGAAWAQGGLGRWAAWGCSPDHRLSAPGVMRRAYYEAWLGRLSGSGTRSRGRRKGCRYIGGCVAFINIAKCNFLTVFGIRQLHHPWVFCIAAGAASFSPSFVEKRDVDRKIAGRSFWPFSPSAFSLIGTFIVRSGMLTSVACLRQRPQSGGVYILGILCSFMGGCAAALIAFRARLEWEAKGRVLDRQPGKPASSRVKQPPARGSPTFVVFNRHDLAPLSSRDVRWDRTVSGPVRPSSTWPLPPPSSSCWPWPCQDRLRHCCRGKRAKIGRALQGSLVAGDGSRGGARGPCWNLTHTAIPNRVKLSVGCFAPGSGVVGLSVWLEWRAPCRL